MKPSDKPAAEKNDKKENDKKGHAGQKKDDQAMKKGDAKVGAALVQVNLAKKKKGKNGEQGTGGGGANFVMGAFNCTVSDPKQFSAITCKSCDSMNQNCRTPTACELARGKCLSTASQKQDWTAYNACSTQYSQCPW